MTKKKKKEKHSHHRLKSTNRLKPNSGGYDTTMTMMMRQYVAVDRARNGVVFDLKSSMLGYTLTSCNQKSPCPPLVSLYAKMSLHRYNFVQGTEFELVGVQKYVKTTWSPAATYYITLDAIDPAAGSLQTFQNIVSEYSAGSFTLTCHIARIRGEPRDGRGFLRMPDMTLPKCPLENPFETYYLVPSPVVQENAWIRLYLELAVAITDRVWNDTGAGLPDLEIVDVAIDAANDEEGLFANNAVFYISYKDWYKSTLGHPLDRIAIVRRSFDKATGCFCLVGQTMSSDVISNMPKEEDTGCSSFNGQIQSPQNFQLESLHL